MYDTQKNHQQKKLMTAAPVTQTVNDQFGLRLSSGKEKISSSCPVLDRDGEVPFTARAGGNASPDESPTSSSSTVSPTHFFFARSPFSEISN